MSPYLKRHDDCVGVCLEWQSADAAIYSPSVDKTFAFDGWRVSISAEALIGSASIGVELDPKAGEFKITPPSLGMGYSFNIDFDFTN